MFMLMTRAATPMRHVESAWQILDGDLGSFGWIVAMRDRRRLYLEPVP
jgi:hypothetical protein